MIKNNNNVLLPYCMICGREMSPYGCLHDGLLTSVLLQFSTELTTSTDHSNVTDEIEALYDPATYEYIE